MGQEELSEGRSEFVKLIRRRRSRAVGKLGPLRVERTQAFCAGGPQKLPVGGSKEHGFLRVLMQTQRAGEVKRVESFERMRVQKSDGSCEEVRIHGDDVDGTQVDLQLILHSSIQGLAEVSLAQPAVDSRDQLTGQENERTAGLRPPEQFGNFVR